MGACPDGGVHTREIDETDQRWLKLATGRQSVPSLAKAISLDPRSLERRIVELADWSPELLRWVLPDEEEETKRNLQFTAALKLKLQWQASQAEAGVNAKFHSTGIRDAHTQFDRIETTVSHYFREPHPALQGRAFGEAFCDHLVEMQVVGVNSRILEIGCGIGYFADRFLGRLKNRYARSYDQVDYTLFDLSPELQTSQKSRCRRHADRITFELGNAESHDFGDRKFDVVIANEMIADLSVGTVNLGNIQQGIARTEAEKLALHYGLDCKSNQSGSRTSGALNVGAIRLLEKLSGLLAPGGRAVLSEYGSTTEMPRAVAFADHSEYSIHFGHLATVAEKLGFRTELGNLGALLGFNGGFEGLRAESFDALSYGLMPALGHEVLPKISYDRSLLRSKLGEEFDRIENLRFEPLQTTSSLSPYRFLILVISRE